MKKAYLCVLVAALLLSGCAPLRERMGASGSGWPSSSEGTGNGKDDGSEEPLTMAALRRDRIRLKGEVERLRGQQLLVDDFLENLFGALEKEDFPQALAFIDRFLRTHPGHPWGARVANLRIAVERIQAVATERENLRQEIRKLKDIQFQFEGLRKEGK